MQNKLLVVDRIAKEIREQAPMLQRVVSCQLLVRTTNALPGDFRFTQCFSNVSVGENRRSVVGVVHGIDLNKFFRWVFLPCILILP
jgi:hypothetical protein